MWLYVSVYYYKAALNQSIMICIIAMIKQYK